MRKVMLILAVFGVLAAGLFTYRSYLVNELRRPVLAKFKDPESAQFRNEKLHGDWSVKGSILCGEVNAKNGMGGYVGFTPFWAASGEKADLGSEPIGPDVVKAQCDI